MKRYIAISLLVVFSLLASSSTAGAQQAIPLSEREALIALYDSTGGPNWGCTTNWLGPPGTEASWCGVSVEDGHVVALRLPSAGLRGPVPSEIGGLGFLRTLDLGGFGLSCRRNGITSLPPEIGQLSRLEVLDLNCGLADELSELPNEIGSLTSLVELRLSQNRLAALPEGIGGLSNLESLYAFSNQIATLPASIGGLSNVTILLLDNNQISNVPDVFQDLTALQDLSLSGNRLESFAPVVEAPALRLLSLSWNEIDHLPENIGQLSQLEYLALSGNELQSLRSGIGDLPQLQSLSLANNRLQSLPPEIGGLATLRTLDLRHNELTALPDELWDLPSLRSLLLGRNPLQAWPSGVERLPGLSFLSIANASMEGALPEEIGNFPNLTRLILRGNRLSGPISTGVIRLSKLGSLDLRYNALPTEDPEVRDFLENHGLVRFGATQTIRPTRVAAVRLDDDTVEVTWDPIDYDEGAGGYQVWFSTTPGGPYNLFGATADKRSFSMRVTGLEAGRTYYFVVRSVTEPHKFNPNRVESEFSTEASDAGAPSIDFFLPLVPSSDGFQGIAASNFAGREVSLELTAYDGDGEPIATSSLRIPSQGQVARLLSEIFPSPEAAPAIS